MLHGRLEADLRKMANMEGVECSWVFYTDLASDAYNFVWQ